MDQLSSLLIVIYGDETAVAVEPRLASILNSYQEKISPRPARDRPRAGHFDRRDTVLITYGDMVTREGERPLWTLARLLNRHVSGLISTVHLLPFYPYSSDDGFSVVDYWSVNPALGDWEDVAEVGRNFRLMFDAVVNHISAQSDWFQGYLRDDPQFRDYFITVDPTTDLSAVFRPRVLPLLTDVGANRHVWTTFSADQIDLNFANPEVLLAIIDLLLFYASKGAELIRLDAIAFLWKDIRTDCLHRPQTHAIIQLWRAILDQVAPHVALITETNVPHEDNISYLGDGHNEAQMVYNFSLPPLTLHAFHTGGAEVLTDWADHLTLPSDQVTFFNFLASHDGIGVTPARGLLPDSAVAAMAERVQRLGGQVSFRSNPDGSQGAYELNINYLDALGDPDLPVEATDLVANRFLATQAIMLALRGVPGIYFHSLFGSRGWPEGVEMTGRARTINRQKLPVNQLEAELAASGSLRQRLFAGYRTLLGARAASPAFNPYAKQQVRRLHPSVFAVQRTALDGSETVLCLHNVSTGVVPVALPAGTFTDLLSGGQQGGPTTLGPYRVMWLRHEE
jgi:glucosylglycerate phosphorylase